MLLQSDRSQRHIRYMLKPAAPGVEFRGAFRRRGLNNLMGLVNLVGSRKKERSWTALFHENLLVNGTVGT